MPFVMFTGVDNHGITVLLGGALLCDETFESYDWVMSSLKNAIGFGPTVLMTDGDANLSASIEKNFPNTRHLLCRWHISQNILKHLSSYFRKGMSDFLDSLWKVSSLESPEEFEFAWKNLVEGIKEKKVIDYLQYLYGKKRNGFSPTLMMFLLPEYRQHSAKNLLIFMLRKIS